jgi:hypothetical protein
MRQAASKSSLALKLWPLQHPNEQAATLVCNTSQTSLQLVA